MSKTARALDQFFTRADVARACVALVVEALAASDVPRRIPGPSRDGSGDEAPRLANSRSVTGSRPARGNSGEWQWVEPSAGQGAFLDLLPPGSIGLDIDNRRSDIVAADFLAWTPPSADRPIVVIGNPPFGKNASLARRFFDHAAGFADVVAFILPRTFEKPAFVDRLDRRMHLIREQALSPDCFELAGEPYAVPVVFQVWEKRDERRPLLAGARGHPDFAFVASAQADFAFQRVGARAGLASIEGLSKSPQSHYFLKAACPAEALLRRLRAIDWAPIKTRTAGNPSIGKAELVAAYRAHHG